MHIPLQSHAIHLAQCESKAALNLSVKTRGHSHACQMYVRVYVMLLRNRSKYHLVFTRPSTAVSTTTWLH
jgi:hypothetical protein